MDELLSFMEEGLEEETQNVQVQDSKSSGGPAKSGKNFEDLFGSPDKRDLEYLGLPSSKKSSKNLSFSLSSNSSASTGLSSCSGSSSKSSVLAPRDVELSRAIKLDKNIPYKPDILAVIDPYSRTRILKNSISIYYDETMSPEAVLKDRNVGLEFVCLGAITGWYRSKGKDVKNFWISGVLVKKTSGVRKSAKGNDYSIWELCDLKNLDKKYTVFLFGSASTSSALSAIPVGALVDLTSPSIMSDASSGAIKFSISNGSQVRLIATSKDFGYCQAKKKDGNKCTAIVNTWECSFCIHHASSELKKLNIGTKKGKGNNKPNKQSFSPNISFGVGGESAGTLKQQGIHIADFGRFQTKSVTSKTFLGENSSSSSPKPLIPVPVLNSRMELQGASREMMKNSIKSGNPETIKFFKNDGNHPILSKEPVAVTARKPLDLNPTKTRHLTDKDRELLKLLDTGAGDKEEPVNEKLSSQKPSKLGSTSNGAISELITSSIVSNPNAASRNFMQYLQLKHAPKDQVDLTSTNKSTAVQPVFMSREKVKSMEKALQFVKKNGPILKSDPNAAGRKRKFHQLSQNESSSPQQGSSKKQSSSTKLEVEFTFESEEFQKILNAKSAHDNELDEIQHEEYFEKLEKKEALENKLLSTYSIETNAVMCRQCKYVALSQSELCKERLHEIRLVKARKRFFKCKDCGNRAMSLDRLPKRPCSNCKSSNWAVAPVGKEKSGPKLPSEMLSVRGNEEKFIGSAASKMFLHLEM